MVQIQVLLALGRGGKDMQTQWYLIRVWITISLHLSRLISSRTVTCCFQCVVLVALITFGLYSPSTPDFSKLGISA